MGNEGPVQIVITGGVIIAGVGYLIAAFINSTKKKFEKLFDKLDDKQDKSQCAEYRQLEKERVERVDQDLQQHKEVER